MELLSINWGNTFIVVGLGFGIVFVILTFLVWVLNIWQRFFSSDKKPKKTEQPKAVKNGKVSNEAAIAAIAAALADNKGAEIAAIAAALHLDAEVIHDTESGILTIKPHQTEWNNKTLSIKKI